MSVPSMDTPLSDSTYSYRMIWCIHFFVFVTSSIKEQDLLRFALVLLGYEQWIF